MRDVVARLSKAAKRLAAPRSLKTSRVGPAAVTLKWAAPKGAAPAYYVVFRDGKSLGKTTRRSYTDSKVKPGKVYRYTVRAYDKRKRAGAPSSSVRVKVPALPRRRRPRPRPSLPPPPRRAGAGPDAAHAPARHAERGDGRPAVLARRLRAHAGRARRVDRARRARI